MLRGDGHRHAGAVEAAVAVGDRIVEDFQAVEIQRRGVSDPAGAHHQAAALVWLGGREDDQGIAFHICIVIQYIQGAAGAVFAYCEGIRRRRRGIVDGGNRHRHPGGIEAAAAVCNGIGEGLCAIEIGRRGVGDRRAGVD